MPHIDGRTPEGERVSDVIERVLRGTPDGWRNEEQMMNEVVEFSPTGLTVREEFSDKGGRGVRSKSILTCEECFALVHEDRVNDHVAWHYPGGTP